MRRRNTKHKEEILTVFNKKHLLSLSDLANLLPHIPFSTLYRNVLRFVEDGLLKEVLFQKIPHYELIHDSSHQHFVCTTCNDILPVAFDEKKIEKLFPKKTVIDSIELVIRGRCPTCTR